jgi:hypothetical protein
MPDIERVSIEQLYMLLGRVGIIIFNALPGVVAPHALRIELENNFVPYRVIFDEKEYPPQLELKLISVLTVLFCDLAARQGPFLETVLAGKTPVLIVAQHFPQEGIEKWPEGSNVVGVVSVQQPVSEILQAIYWAVQKILEPQDKGE